MTDPRSPADPGPADPGPADPGPVDPDVELASAHLDGEAGPDERARAEDPAVRARAAELGAVVDRVRDVPPPPAGLLDDHVARAMQDFDRDATVVPLGPARAGSWWQRIPLGAVAAALVVVALVGAIGLASRAGDGDAADTATAALDSADDEAAERSAGATGGGSGTADDSAEPMEESTTLEAEADMGAPGVRAAYDSFDALADDLRAELGATAPSSGQVSSTTESLSADDGSGSGSAVDQDPCGAVELLDLEPTTVVVVRSVLVGPDRVTVVVHGADDGRRLVAVDQTCTVVVDRVL